MAVLEKLFARSDERIRKDVLSEFKWDPRLSSPDIAVTVKDGVVTLAGFVTSSWERDAAAEAAKRVYGVKAVANDLQVRPAATRTDPEIARDVVHALANHVSIPSEDIKVLVKDGWITLEGIAEWQFQKELAETLVKNLRGVVGVTNKIAVEPRVSPSEIKSKIEDALLRSAEIDARRITVEIEGGTVKLYGSVRSWAEKRAALEAAWAGPGVTAVEDHLTVTP